jgi:hypothetical protein
MEETPVVAGEITTGVGATASELALMQPRSTQFNLGLKPATILDKWERGELPGYRFGRAVRFDLVEILELGRHGATAPLPPRRGPRPVR